MSPLPFTLNTAAGLLRKRDGPPKTALMAAGIVLVVLLVLSLSGGTWFFVRRWRRRRQQLHSERHDSFVPNNFKVIGGLYATRRSRAPSTSTDSRSSTQPYAPTTEYGQYRPPVPKPAYFAPGSARHSTAILVRHARDKSLPSLP